MELDLSVVTQPDEIFDFLVERFGFPDLYGSGWYAMSEHVFYDPMNRIPEKVYVKNIDSLKALSPELHRGFVQWLSEFPAGVIVVLC